MKRLMLILAALTIACNVSTVAQLPPPMSTATARPVPSPLSTVTEVIALQTVNITTATDLHIRACASLSCEVVTVATAGTILSAVCTGDWCMVPAYGWFCLPAAQLRGGCE
jgi:hypothetical protein